MKLGIQLTLYDNDVTGETAVGHYEVGLPGDVSSKDDLDAIVQAAMSILDFESAIQRLSAKIADMSAVHDAERSAIIDEAVSLMEESNDIRSAVPAP